MVEKKFVHGAHVVISEGPYAGFSGRVSSAPSILPTTARMPGDRPHENLVVDLTIDGEVVMVCLPASSVDHGPDSDGPPR